MDIVSSSRAFSATIGGVEYVFSAEAPGTKAINRPRIRRLVIRIIAEKKIRAVTEISVVFWGIGGFDADNSAIITVNPQGIMTQSQLYYDEVVRIDGIIRSQVYLVRRVLTPPIDSYTIYP